MTDNIIKILGKDISYEEAPQDIYQLKFYEKNPRVLSKLDRAESLAGSHKEKQEVLKDLLIQEPSVKKLIKTIQEHRGLMEPLIVQRNTKEVLEGNSRLAALRTLYTKEEDQVYLQAPCRIVDLEDEQIDAFLYQQHINGKTEWSAFAKAYSAYRRVVQDGVSIEHFVNITSSNKDEIQKRINTIKLMKKQGMDGKTDRFSHYEQFYRSKNLKPLLEDNPNLENYVLQGIKQDKLPWSASQLRDGIPQIAKKSKVLKKLIDGEIEFIDALERSRISKPKELIAKARTILDDVSKAAIDQLDNNEKSAVKIEVKKCSRQMDRIKKMFGIGVEHDIS